MHFDASFSEDVQGLSTFPLNLVFVHQKGFQNTSKTNWKRLANEVSIFLVQLLA